MPVMPLCLLCRYDKHCLFVTLQEFSAFLCIKAVWGIEGKWGYELATVLNSTFCYELLSMNTRCRATSRFMAHHRVQR